MLTGFWKFKHELYPLDRLVSQALQAYGFIIRVVLAFDRLIWLAVFGAELAKPGANCKGRTSFGLYGPADSRLEREIPQKLCPGRSPAHYEPV